MGNNSSNLLLKNQSKWKERFVALEIKWSAGRVSALPSSSLYINVVKNQNAWRDILKHIGACWNENQAEYITKEPLIISINYRAVKS